MMMMMMTIEMMMMKIMTILYNFVHDDYVFNDEEDEDADDVDDTACLFVWELRLTLARG